MAIIPITRAIPPIMPIKATIGHISLSPIHPTIDKATTRTIQVPKTLKQKFDVVITSHFNKFIFGANMLGLKIILNTLVKSSLLT